MSLWLYVLCCLRIFLDLYGYMRPSLSTCFIVHGGVFWLCACVCVCLFVTHLQGCQVLCLCIPSFVDFTFEYIQREGLREPIIFEKADGLGIQ